MDSSTNIKIKEVIQRINDDPADTISNDMVVELTDLLSDSELYVPVDDDEMKLYGWGQRIFIPVFTGMDEFEKTFDDTSPEIFFFRHLSDFLTPDIDGIIINPEAESFILNRTLSQIAFNADRPRKPESRGYDVKVRLNDFRPLTWRDLIIPADMTFMELDDVLKTLWDFNGHHLSCFLIGRDNLTIIDDELSRETMMGCDFDANTTSVGEIFSRYDKVTYWYDFGDDWRFDIEIKKEIDYDKDYVTIKRFKGKYNPVEDCQGVYGLSEIVYYAENPDEADSSYFCQLVDYLWEFDMEFSQLRLERKSYVKSNWHRDVYVERGL